MTEECVLCRSPLREDIDRMLGQEKASEKAVNSFLERHGEPTVHRNTVSKHRNKHVVAFVRKRAIEVRETAREVGVHAGPTNQDLAVLARDRAVQRLNEGSLDVSMADGLKAQEMIDKRAQRGADGDFIAKITVLLTGGPRTLTLPDVIDAEFREEREADEAELRQLMAGD